LLVYGKITVLEVRQLLSACQPNTNLLIPDWLWTVTNPWGIVVIAVAGIWLSWSTKYIKKMAGNIALWRHLRQNKHYQQTEAVDGPTERSTLLGTGSGSSISKDALPLARIYKEKSGIRDLLAEVFFPEDLGKVDRIRLLRFTTIVILLAAGLIVGGWFLTKIRVDGPARLASNKCGLWLFEGDKRSEAATRARMLDLQKEERAAQFAEDCYGPPSPTASRCSVLYSPVLPVSKAYTNDCPFAPEICLLNQTVTFKTPITDAKELGINAASTPKFSRSTACTPLSMDYPYIQNTTVNDTTTYTYHYGTKREEGGLVNHTYMTVGKPWDRLAPIYDVFAYSSNADNSDHPVWTPHPHLTHPRYSTVTIIFVSSLRILYEEHSDDYIFPADENYPLPDDPRPWFRNSDPRARPLACINTVEVCTADGKMCWNLNEPTNNTTAPDDTPEFVLLYSSLYKTDIYYSMAKRQGRSLLAQKKVSQYFSAGLGDDPWVAEVENWVHTSLARTSINTWSVASGEDAVHEGKGGFIEITKGYDLCGRYKYNAQGYQSLLLGPIILVFAWLPLIWGLTLDGKLAEQNLKKPYRILKGCAGLAESTVLALRLQRVHLRGGHDQQDTSTSTRGVNVLPNPTDATGETAGQQQGESAPAGPSRAATSHQHVALQSTIARSDTPHTSTTQNAEIYEEHDVEWETLVVWQLLYCLWFILSRLGLVVGLIFCLPWDFFQGRHRRAIRQRTLAGSSTVN
jgi:hypothetical protein